MRWTSRSRTDVRGVIDKFQLYDRTISELRVKLRGSGVPCTFYRNTAIDAYGSLNKTGVKCYCWGSQEGQPDRSHFLCMGTGFLSSYQKYGYEEITISTPSTVTKEDHVLITGERNSRFVISSPTLLTGRITTEQLPLSQFRSVDRFLVNDWLETGQSRIRYYFTTDDTTWTEISLQPYTESTIATRQGMLSVPTDAEFIRFSISLEKRASSSSSPAFNSLRFRYRKQLLLNQIDPRYITSIPAFLAAREQQTIEIKQGQYGWETNRPLRWWTLPEVDILNSDVIMFLEGYMQNQYYEISNLTPHVHGPSGRLIHKSFESSYIRDANDILKITHLLK